MRPFGFCVHVLAGVLALGCSIGPRTPRDQIIAALPEAASMSTEAFDAMARRAAAPALGRFENQSLTAVLLTLPAADTDAFRVLAPERGPATLAAALTAGGHGYASVIQPGTITHCTCEVQDGTAKGTVAFRSPGVFEGRAHYVARRVDNAWRIEVFHLPGPGILLKRQSDGNWKVVE